MYLSIVIRTNLSLSLYLFYSGCFPYIKYHCSQRPKGDDLTFDNRLYTIFKCFNLGIPTLMYGLAAIFLIRHSELVYINRNVSIKIYFLLKENPGASF